MDQRDREKLESLDNMSHMTHQMVAQWDVNHLTVRQSEWLQAELQKGENVIICRRPCSSWLLQTFS